MITLYVKTGCPYCAKVLASMQEHGVQFEEKNIKDPKVVAELIEIGGKRQVPFLGDDNMTPYLVDDDIEMYESEDIVKYITKKFSKGRNESEVDIHAKKHNLHVDDGSNVCDGCE